MFTLLVSSKTMQPGECPFDIEKSQPIFSEQAKSIDSVLKSKSPRQLQKLMHISPKLAEATYDRIQYWGSVKQTPAWYTFVGDVYKGLEIEGFTKDDLEFAQEHMATLSGLYGLLRPLDLIHPYRLELGYKLTGKGFKNLYDFWGDLVTKEIASRGPIINLSSEEYIKVVRPHVNEQDIITPWFMQIKNGQPEFQAIHAKIARGAMARWICKNKIDDPSKLLEFAEDRYSYSEELSTPQSPTFTREFIPVAVQS